jgi:hypothetical protein
MYFIIIIIISIIMCNSITLNIDKCKCKIV